MKTKPNLKPLTRLECETLLWLLKDCSTKKAAEHCHISEDAMESRTKKLRVKVNARHIGAVIFRLMYFGLIPQEIVERLCSINCVSLLNRPLTEY